MVVLLATGLVSGVALVADRETGHLALWRVTQSDSRETFARPPSPRVGALPAPAPDLPPVTAPASTAGDLDRARLVALQVMSLCGRPSTHDKVRWASVEDMIRQARNGAVADCWPRAILFGSFATSAGLNARVWALEGDGFAGDAHTVPEVYVSEWRRWVMIDPTLNALARDRDGVPLGVLDLRDRILEDRVPIQYEPIDPRAGHIAIPATYYPAHVRYSFLRRQALLDARDRFGVLAPFAAWLDRWPEPLKKAAAAVLGTSGDVLYFHDAHNASLQGRSLVAKACLGTFLASLAGVVLSAIALVATRRRAVVAG